MYVCFCLEYHPFVRNTVGIVFALQAWKNHEKARRWWVGGGELQHRMGWIHSWNQAIWLLSAAALEITLNTWSISRPRWYWKPDIIACATASSDIPFAIACLHRIGVKMSAHFISLNGCLFFKPRSTRTTRAISYANRKFSYGRQRRKDKVHRRKDKKTIANLLNFSSYLRNIQPN